jgi:carnosine N-methyltransferase
MKNMLRLENIICPVCNYSLKSAKVHSNHLHCINCGAAWPLINQRFPVLLQNASAHLHASFKGFVHHRKGLEEERKKWNKLAEQYPQRRLLFEEAAAAITHNLAHAAKIQASIQPFIEAEQLAETMTATGSSGYDFIIYYYLEKDWQQTDANKKVWNKLMAPVLNALDKYAFKRQTAMLLGAGAGRFTWEISPLFHSVCALDNSITMAWTFGEVQKETLFYYDIKFTNNLSRSSHVNLLKAGLPLNEAKVPDNIFYCIADAGRIPVEAHSQDVVFSVYFTDVLPLHEWLPEVKRVIQPGGLFIHYGPLTYHFGTEAYMYAADELEEIFTAQGFVTLLSEVKEEPVAEQKESLLGAHYNNWLWVCRYELPVMMLGMNDCIALNPALRYEITNGFDTDAASTVLLKLGNQTLATSEAVIELLQLVNSNSTIAELITEFSGEYEIDETAANTLLNTLNQLLEQQFISKVKK